MESDKYTSGRKDRLTLLSLAGIIIAHVFSVYKLFFSPYPELFVYPYLTNIGLLPYKQILDQHFPGLMFFPINLSSLGFVNPQGIFILHLAVIVSIQVLLFSIVKNVFKSNKTALLACFFYFLWQPYLEGNVLWIDSFLPLLLLPSSYLLYSKKYFWSGIFLGLGIVMKQVLIPFALLIVLYFLMKKSRKPLLHFFLGLSAPVLIMLTYIFNIGVFKDFVFWTYTFNMETFAEMGRKYASFNELVKVSAIFLPAIAYSVIIFYKNKKAAIFTGFFWGTFLFVYARFDPVHLQPALPFASIFLALLFSKFPGKLREYSVVLYILLSAAILWQYHAALSSKSVRFYGEKEKRLSEAVAGVVEKDDPIFAMATTPHLYHMTNTRPAGNVFSFHFPWFMAEAEDRIFEAIKKDPPKLIIRDKNAATSGVNLVSHMPNINKLVEENYILLENIDDIEILIPKYNENSN